MSGQAPGTREVRVRRGPKVGVFLVLGVLVGALAAVVLTLVTPPSRDYSTTQVLGFLVLILAPIGAMLAGLVAVVLDAASSRRARTATAEVEREEDRAARRDEDGTAPPIDPLDEPTGADEGDPVAPEGDETAIPRTAD